MLLAALAGSLRQWTGSASVVVDMEGHGREEIVPGFDCSRTVGWFTSIFPVALDLHPNATPEEILRATKERLRGIPHRGLGYGVLRYLADDATRRRMETLPRGQVLLNYLGQSDRAWSNPWLSTARESVGPLRSSANHRPYPLEVSGAVQDGRLVMEWRYSEDAYRRGAIEDLDRQVRKILRGFASHDGRPGPGALSPSDFSAGDMSQTDFDELLTRLNPPA